MIKVDTWSFSIDMSLNFSEAVTEEEAVNILYTKLESIGIIVDAARAKKTVDHFQKMSDFC